MLYLQFVLHCFDTVWLGVCKSIRPVKIEWWDVGVVICLEQGADCLHMVQLMPLPSQTPSSPASFKSRLVLPFWHRLTQVVVEKRPWNGHVCVCVCCICSYLVKFLARLAESSEVNKMTAANLAIVIAPSLLWAPPQDHSLLANSGSVHVYFQFHFLGILLHFFPSGTIGRMLD